MANFEFKQILNSIFIYCQFEFFKSYFYNV